MCRHTFIHALHNSILDQDISEYILRIVGFVPDITDSEIIDVHVSVFDVLSKGFEIFRIVNVIADARVEDICKLEVFFEQGWFDFHICWKFLGGLQLKWEVLGFKVSNWKSTN